MKTGHFVCATFLFALLLLTLPAFQAYAQEMEYLSGEVTFPDGSTFRCQLADDVAKRSTGLKNHLELPPGQGMLFVYPYPSNTSFWMPPEMKFPLDMIFLDNNKRVVHLAEKAQPCKDTSGNDCDSYSPDRRVSFVVEVPAGTIEKTKLKKGNLLKIKFPRGYRFPQG